MLLQELIKIPSVNPSHASPDQADVAADGGFSKNLARGNWSGGHA
jgi:hypothetical protein